MGKRYRLVVALFLAIMATACQSTNPVTPSVAPDHESITDGSLVVFHPPGEDWQLIARETVTVLVAGRDTGTNDFGLHDPGMGLLLVQGSAGVYRRGSMVPHPVTGASVEIFIMPVRDPAALATDLRQGHDLLGGQTPGLQAARHVALFLQVHEMLHVLLEGQLTPGAFHLWLNEGLAEYFAWRTAEAQAPDALPGFLDDRLSELSKLPPDGAIDFLAWSAADSEMLRRLMLPDGEVITFGWSNGRKVNEVRRAVNTARDAADQLDEMRAEDLRRGARLWEEWIETVSTSGGQGRLSLSSEDDRTRWGVYAGLLALFLEMDAAGLDPERLIETLRQPRFSRGDVRQEMDAAGEFHEVRGLRLTATNAEITALLPDIDGVPIAELVRRYPVDRARRVLEAQRSRVEVAEPGLR